VVEEGTEVVVPGEALRPGGLVVAGYGQCCGGGCARNVGCALNADSVMPSLSANCRHASDWADLRLSFRSAFLRDRRVCFHYWVVESPAGNGAHAIKAGEDA
jgi:hypothetical protein